MMMRRHHRGEVRCRDEPDADADADAASIAVADDVPSSASDVVVRTVVVVSVLVFVPAHRGTDGRMDGRTSLPPPPYVVASFVVILYSFPPANADKASSMPLFGFPDRRRLPPPSLPPPVVVVVVVVPPGVAVGVRVMYIHIYI